ncbi:hypothetical protein [Thermococcus peptonophilus]|uniref:Uncharacterized protein n=1 Tax=Thermococcus peptonophilus TaxID=53952 RepID=A0A142CV80_9EURY|nr:hypothetical protein [Thermococcus peptonophilus]AMQ18682.1 hypothetical protein A0127_05620 [Thermococcus peptonophilus]
MDFGKAVHAFVILLVTLFVTIKTPSVEQVLYNAFTPFVFQASQTIQAYDLLSAILLYATWFLVGVAVVVAIVAPVRDALLEFISSLG